MAHRVLRNTAEAVMSILKCTPLLMTLLAVACRGGNTEPQADEPGEDRAVTTATLETGANLLQSKAPIEKISTYLNGFHAAKDDPNMQMESHHYCDQMNEEWIANEVGGRAAGKAAGPSRRQTF